MNGTFQYSYVLYANNNFINEKLDEIFGLLTKGVKVLLFSDSNFEILSTGYNVEKFLRAKLLQIHKEDITITEVLEVIDGQSLDIIEHIAKSFPQFNVEQFVIEHAPFDENIMVKAGAGTGKTTVMIERILYLLLAVKLKPAEIVMITFTREASRNMYNKLRESLFFRFQATGNQDILRLIEHLADIRIQTIHSFSKSLLKEVGSLGGFGLNVALRSFKQEKKTWIEEGLNRFFEEELSQASGTIETLISPLKLYELIDTIYDFSEKFEQKGFSTTEILEKTDFGKATIGNQRMNNLLQTVIRDVEHHFQEEKNQLNAVTMSDLTRQIDDIREKHGATAFENLSQPISHLFVDEFQDSDDIQIRLIATIQEAFTASLFVVGDIKQSIYRFRGAKHTAFKILKEKLEQRDIFIDDDKYFLKKNYRTTKQLLEQMDTYFSTWGEKGYLDYNVDDEESSDRLVGMRTGEEEEPLRIETKREETKTNMRTHILPRLVDCFKGIVEINQSKPEGEKREKLAVLTRTIEEARLVDEWCRGQKLLTKLEVGGGFYTSKAVRHFHSLVLALLYPSDGKYLSNLLDGPYGQGKEYLLHDLVNRKGSQEDAVNKLKEATTFPFDRYHRLLTYQPVLSVLRTIIEERQPYNWIYSRRVDELSKLLSDDYTPMKLQKQAINDTKKYQLNVGKLFEKLHQAFSAEFVSLQKIESWLRVQIATNRDEEEMTVEGMDTEIDHVHILTAHRAKGLEYHTVIIPYTERPFTTSFSKIIFDDNREKVGWLINKQGYEERKNEYFELLNPQDDTESIQEETRLLYVAMTRAKNELIIIRNLKNDNYNMTWSKLLRKTR
ncbi:UvrD-helicase domain-containing protein [Peribacillus frigoritolerans]|uniref:UvrD-helicase domain-containing protein n=1 Tax=Peribacillus frigoritolerans TaxID=450367 RepID=UPI0032E4C8FC